MNSSVGYIQVLKRTGVKKAGYFNAEFIPNEFGITNLWFTEICHCSNFVYESSRKKKRNVIQSVRLPVRKQTTCFP